MTTENPSGWHTVDRDGVQVLTKDFTFDDFNQAMRFASRVGEAADAADHHPEIVISWGRVRVHWWSHDVGGISQRDHDLADATDRLYP
jgi:4a-hydroxytetrahydrobiopterin dehydratase